MRVSLFLWASQVIGLRLQEMISKIQITSNKKVVLVLNSDDKADRQAGTYFHVIDQKVSLIRKYGKLERKIVNQDRLGEVSYIKVRLIEIFFYEKGLF